jgi:hypothetical protein
LSFTDETGESWGDGAPRDYYLPKWVPVLRGQSRRAGFNRAAWFCGMTWCFWRKLYLVGIALVCAEIAGIFVLSVLFVLFTGIQNPDHIAFAAMPWVSLLLVRTCFGAISNRIYLRRTLTAIRRLRGSAPELERRVSLLRRRGGTSGIALTVAILLNLASLAWASYGRLAAA